MDGLYWKTLLKWMIWGYHYFRKHPYTTWKVDGDRQSQVRWQKVRGHDKPRRMGVAIAIYPFQGVFLRTLEVFSTSLFLKRSGFYHTNELSGASYDIPSRELTYPGKIIFLSLRWDMLVSVCDSLKSMIFYQIMWGSITRWFHQPSNETSKFIQLEEPCTTMRCCEYTSYVYIHPF